MDKIKHIIIFLLLLFIFVSVVEAWEPYGDQPNQQSCNKHPEVTNGCYWVHGRLSIYNGTPSARIWKIGTKRILGISEDHALPNYEQMPKSLEKLIVSPRTVIFGDFEFCPYTKEEQGVMQLGCIQSIDNVIVKNKK